MCFVWIPHFDLLPPMVGYGGEGIGRGDWVLYAHAWQRWGKVNLCLQNLPSHI
jgi:hypothetical protein